MSPESFSGVILAGGGSTRMGRDKAFLRLPDGMTLLQRQIGIMEAAGIGEIFISGRPEVDYGPQRWPVLLDEEPGLGPMGGMREALRRMGKSHLLVLAVDLPRMETGFLQQLMKRSGPDWGILPFLNGFCEPLIASYPRDLLPLLENQLREGHRAVYFVGEEAIRLGTLRRFDVPEQDKLLFCNWNAPADFVP